VVKNIAEDRLYPQLAQEYTQIPAPLSYLVPSDRLKKMTVKFSKDCRMFPSGSKIIASKIGKRHGRLILIQIEHGAGSRAGCTPTPN